jgi:hypothetical protein
MSVAPVNESAAWPLKKLRKRPDPSQSKVASGAGAPVGPLAPDRGVHEPVDRGGDRHGLGVDLRERGRDLGARAVPARGQHRVDEERRRDEEREQHVAPVADCVARRDGIEPERAADRLVEGDAARGGPLDRRRHDRGRERDG